MDQVGSGVGTDCSFLPKVGVARFNEADLRAGSIGDVNVKVNVNESE